MKIGLDFDGVVVDSHRLKATLLKEVFQSDVPIEACRNHIQRHCGIRMHKEYLHVQRLVYENKTYHERLEFMPGAERRIKQLRDRRHELTIISSRSPQAATLGLSWLKTRKLDVPFIPTGRHASKAATAKQLGLDCFVDDDLVKLNQLMGTVSKLYLFRQPHNAMIKDAGPHIEIVKSWAEVGKSLSVFTEVY
ncbi:MAG: HAD hydrolase-like protein [Patescibacteria group bacterium]